MLQKFKPCFAVKSCSHRPDFPNNMTDDERMIMDQHSKFWDMLLLDGSALATGPMQDTNGTYGFAIIFADSVEAARALLKDDPAQQISEYSYSPMLVSYDAK